MNIKKLVIPNFENFDIWKRYGISNQCYIGGSMICRPFKICAVCFNKTKDFENSEMGLEEAVKWLEIERLCALGSLGVEVKE